MSKWIYSCFLVFLLCSCNNTPQTDENTNFFAELVQQWNKAHNDKDTQALQTLYAPQVLFYTEPTDNVTCAEKKKQFLRANPDFYQQIKGDITTEVLENGNTKCTFVKSVTLKGKTNDYPSYLTFEKQNNQWYIVTESDLVTDKNIAKKGAKLDNKLFVKGLKAGQAYSYNQLQKGGEYTYKSKEQIKLRIALNAASLIDLKYNKELITPVFGVGYNQNADTLNEETTLVVGQYDFDKDGIDELIVALQNEDEINNGIALNIYSLQNHKWVVIGANLMGDTILGEPIAEIKNNQITVKKYLRDFYYQWTYEYGYFKDTGDY